MKKQIWFRRKTYGWGWTPCTWQGWLILAVYLVIIIRFARVADGAFRSDSKAMLAFLVPCIISTVVLIAVCRIFGEKPRWQWGNKPNPKP